MTKRKPRCVVDTSVLISAILTRGKPNQVVTRLLARGIILVSEATLSELETRLRRKKFSKYLSPEKRETYLALIRERSRQVDVTSTVADCRDPKDNKFLELALDGRADLIVSSDNDLQVLHPYHGIPILSPADFLEHMR